MRLPEGSELIFFFEWEYADKTKEPHKERLYRLPNGEFAREQITEGKEISDWLLCSPERVLELLVMLEKQGYFPIDYCDKCGADNGPIWPADTHGKYREGQACCSCKYC